MIGSGWAVRVLARSHDVIAWDPADGAEDRLRSALERAWPAATRLGLFPGADPARLRWANTAEEVAASADWVQESAPEDPVIKRPLLRRLDAAADPATVIASSSSGLLASHLAEGLTHPQRLLIGHPFNPVYLLPLVEVVPGEATSQEVTAAAVQHYDDLVMYPLVVRNEIEGYLSDRLQEALWRENLHLVDDGTATTAELDDSIIYGPGLRWAAMGTNLTFHLAGGDGGMRHMLNQFGPALKLPWTRLKAPELTDDLVEAMAEGCRQQAGGRSVAELEKQRDSALIAVMRALRPTKIGAGRLIAEREARILAARAAEATQPWTPDTDVAAPLRLYSAVVEPDWVDYNDHMTEAAFLTVFGWASDALFRYLGIDEDYRAAGHSYYTVETHINYRREATLDEPLLVTTQILASDAKRLHIFHSMHRVDTGSMDDSDNDSDNTNSNSSSNNDNHNMRTGNGDNTSTGDNDSNNDNHNMRTDNGDNTSTGDNDSNNDNHNMRTDNGDNTSTGDNDSNNDNHNMRTDNGDNTSTGDNDSNNDNHNMRTDNGDNTSTGDNDSNNDNHNMRTDNGDNTSTGDNDSNNDNTSSCSDGDSGESNTDNDNLGELLCTAEQILLHVDTTAGRSTPLLPGPAAALAAVTAAHATMPTPPEAGRRMAIRRAS